MTVLSNLVKKLEAVESLCHSIRTAEKARIAMLKNEAADAFKMCYEEYVRSQSIINSVSAETQDNSELHVKVAEMAYETENIKLARLTVERFLQLKPQPNQHFCRAKILMGLLICVESKDMNGNDSIKNQLLAINCLLEALEVATSANNAPRYKFLVFNVSVAYWKIINGQLRHGRAKYFIESISKIVDALQAQNDPDVNWRIMFLSAAALCCDDGKNTKQATDYTDAAIELANQLLTKTTTEHKKIESELKEFTAESDKIMNAFREIEEREELIHKPRKLDPDQPDGYEVGGISVDDLPPLEGLAGQGYEHVKQLLDESQSEKAKLDGQLRVLHERKMSQQEAVSRLYMQRLCFNTADSKKVLGIPQIVQDVRMNTLVQLQAILTNCIAEKDVEPTFNQLFQKLQGLPPSAIRNETFLDVARVCRKLKMRSFAKKCEEIAQDGTIVSRVLRVKLDVCAGLEQLSSLEEENANQLTMQRLTSKQTEGFMIDRRIEIVRNLERTMQVCLSSRCDELLIQEICIIMWNSIIPLLQTHLRLKVHPCIRMIATALQTISSPMSQLRAEVLYELSKCEEQSDYVALAKDEGVKALSMDCGALEADEEYKERMKPEHPEVVELNRQRPLDVHLLPWVELLEMRSSVFQTPKDVEGQVLLWLQQAHENNNPSFIEGIIRKSVCLMLQEIQDDEPEEYIEGRVKSLEERSRAGSHSTTDFSVLMMKMGTIIIDPVPLEKLEKLLGFEVNKPVGSEEGVGFHKFTKLLQKRVIIMSNIAKFAYKVHDVNILQQAVVYVLKFRWDPKDPLMKSLVEMQVEAYNLLSDSFLHRIKHSPIQLVKQGTVKEKGTLIETPSHLEEKSSDEGLKGGPNFDPRSLGLTSTETSTEIVSMKRLSVVSLSRGMQLALSIKDCTAVQNALVYFWNLHLHVFRGQRYPHAFEELYQFLEIAVEALESLQKESKAGPPPPVPHVEGVTTVDPRLLLSVYEVLSEFSESKGLILFQAKAEEGSMEGATELGTAVTWAQRGSQEVAPEYLKKRICENYSRLMFIQSKRGANPGGGKGGGKGAAAAAGEPPKYDDQPFLTVFSLLARAEMIPETNWGVAPTPEELKSLVEKAVTVMEGDVSTHLSGEQWEFIPQERFSQLIEMQVECWSRLTRLRIMLGDTIGAQYTSEKCLNVVSEENLSAPDERILSPRVWRWVSVCERLFGLAISNIIQPDGQEPSLQFELRLIALSHFSKAGVVALRAKQEELAVTASIDAWNVCIPLISRTELRPRFFKIVKQIIEVLLKVKVQAVHHEQAHAPKEVSVVMQLRQQFYLAVIEGFANVFDWDNALNYVLEAFSHVVEDLQKPLWQWRVVAMSKKGKNVLDGLQKLKEDDPFLQAQVYGVLARSSNNPKLQLESYMKAVEILSESMERVEFLIEAAQWMASAGVPRVDIGELLRSAMDALYEVEEQSMVDIRDMDEEEAEEVLNKGITSTAEAAETGTELDGKSNVPSMARSMSQRSRGTRGTTSGAKTIKRAGSTTLSTGKMSRSKSKMSSAKGSVKSTASAIVEKLPERLNFKHLDQAMRILVMSALLECHHSKRAEKLYEALYFLEKARDLWFGTLKEVSLQKRYSELPPEQREDLTYEAWKTTEAAEEIPEFLLPPTEPLLLINWVKMNESVVELMQIAAKKSPLDIPSKTSLPTPALTLHYLIELIDSLRDLGLFKYSLQCCAWVILLLNYFGPPSLENREAAYTVIHLKINALLCDLGLDEESANYSTSMPRDENDFSLSLSVGTFLTEFIKDTTADFTKNNGDETEENKEMLDPPPSPFGFSVWTPQMSGSGSTATSVDTAVYLLSVCSFMQEHIGLYPLSSSLALTLKKVFLKRKEPKALTACSTVLARAHLTDGDTQQTIATLLRCREEELSIAGDGRDFAQQTILLMDAYVRTHEVDEAIQIARVALQLLQDESQKKIDKTAVLGSVENSDPPPPPQPPATMSRVNTASASTALVGTSMKTLPPPPQILVESSLVNVNAMAEVALKYADVLALSASSLFRNDEQVSGGSGASNSKDPRPLYLDLCEKLNGCHDLVSDILGRSSNTALRLLEKRVNVACDLLTQIHREASAQIPLEMYHNWMVDNVLLCLEYQEKLLTTAKEVVAAITPSDLSYTSEEIISSALTEVSTGLIKAPYKAIFAPQVRRQIRGELQLVFLKMFLAMHKKEHLSKNDFATPERLDTIQTFLKETEAPSNHDLQDFSVSLLQRAAQESGSTAATLKNYLHSTTAKDLSTTSEILFAVCSVLRLSGDGAFDAMWQPDATPDLPPPVSIEETSMSGSGVVVPPLLAGSPASELQTTVEGEDEIKVKEPSPLVRHRLTLPEEAKTVRELLATQVTKTLAGGQTLPFSDGGKITVYNGPPMAKSVEKNVPYACFALVESFGRGRSGAAARWLLQLQSFYSAQWLKEQWLAALNPTSPVSAAWYRLQKLLEKESIDGAVRSQIMVEHELLKQTSVAYRRLNITANPASIIQRYSPPKTVFLSVQLCPLREVLYICVGTKQSLLPKKEETPLDPKAGGKKAPASKKAPVVEVDTSVDLDNLDDELWLLEKMVLTEQQRRMLDLVVHQQTTWQADVTKFVAVNGDQTTADFDLECSESSDFSGLPESRALLKGERALEERLRALISDLEMLLAPLLRPAGNGDAPEGSITSFIRKMTGHSVSKPTGENQNISPVSGVSLCLISDVALQVLPFEAMGFADLFEGRVSRDFSVHMLHHRLQTIGVMDGGVTSVPAAGVRYLMDPLFEDAGNRIEGFQRQSLSESLNEMRRLLREGQKGGDSWRPIRLVNSGEGRNEEAGETDGLVSLEDFIQALDKSAKENHTVVPSTNAKGKGKAEASNTEVMPSLPNTMLFSYILGRFGSILPTSDIAAMDLEGLRLMVSLDGGHTETSFRRANSSDVVKTPALKSSEQALPVCAVLSLCGTGCVVAQQWPSPLTAQHRLLRSFWSAFTGLSGEVPATVVRAMAFAAGYGRNGVSADGEGSGGSEGKRRLVKKWIRYSRVVYGIPTVTYSVN